MNFKNDAFPGMSEVTQEKNQFLKGKLQDEMIRKVFFQGEKIHFSVNNCTIALTQKN